MNKTNWRTAEDDREEQKEHMHPVSSTERNKKVIFFFEYIKKVEKVYLMVTGLAKWLRKRRKKEREEKAKRKKPIQRAKCERKSVQEIFT
jgi:hypothetical protein